MCCDPEDVVKEVPFFEFEPIDFIEPTTVENSAKNTLIQEESRFDKNDDETTTNAGETENEENNEDVKFKNIFIQSFYNQKNSLSVRMCSVLFVFGRPLN